MTAFVCPSLRSTLTARPNPLCCRTAYRSRRKDFGTAATHFQMKSTDSNLMNINTRVLTIDIFCTLGQTTAPTHVSDVRLGDFTSSGNSAQLHKGTNSHTYASECRCASHAEVAANTVPCKARTANMRSLSTGGSCSIVSAADRWF